ncbi:sensor domain-containing protein [Streptomyces sp. ISL-98]|uniref:sensor histidine kinase n=1 Tax=Streptomyces sp. ISL-98 TaxID=2819192 RepID=UPI001BE73A6A|nr:sensor histidine kinase [Streptomyces sp. ISL-98]MBT2505043.1 sensor domain-containing protein [Streptomyces sp. ISL-98]
MHRLRAAATALLYAALALPLALTGMALVVTGLLAGALLSVTALGPWLLALTVRGALALGDLQRALALGLLGLRIDPPVRRDAPGAFGWRRAVLGDRAGWRAVGCSLAAPFTALPPVLAAFGGYAYGLLFVLNPIVKRWNYITVREADGSVRHVGLRFGGVEFDSWPRWLITTTAGLLLLAVTPWFIRRLLVPHRILLRTLLGPNAADQRIRTLEETRAQAVDDAAATLRRIERDLHDGTQARLVGLGMHLTMIRELLAADVDRDRIVAVVETAQGNAKAAVADLRHLVKGIHPPVLDQGLDTALATLAADSPLSVPLTADIAERPAPAIESIAYFCAAELLANAVKHSGATRAAIGITVRDGTLRLAVRDNGRGGAAVGAGSGLTGLLARVRTVDGTLTCDSPPGGPTVVTVLLPCR